MRAAGRARRPLTVGVVVVVVGLGAAACNLFDGASDASTTAGGGTVAAAQTTGPPDAALPEVDTAALVQAIDQESAGTIVPVRLAAGLTPPTNRWFSGLVFGAGPTPVYPLPLSFGLTADGFTLGLPRPVTNPAGIMGPHVPAVTVSAGAASSRVSAYDAVTVTVELLDTAGAVLGRVVIAQGSPFVSFTAVVATTLTQDVAFRVSPGGAGEASATVRETEYGLVVPGGPVGEGREVRLAPGETASWYPVPADADASARAVLATAAADPVVGSQVTYGVDDHVARTSIGYATAGGSPSVYATMPHHRLGDQPSRSGCGLGTYPSVYGTLELCAGSTLSSFAPALPAVGALDVSRIPADRRATIVAQLATDVAATVDLGSTTYFGGKALYRAATLVQLGDSLGASDVVAPLRDRAQAVLREWAEPDGCTRRQIRCFVYDPVARGVIGLAPEFGSEEFNDHHFHYGYFLAAAGLLAAGDPELAADVRPVMDLLAQDIAAATPTDQLPQLRTFDVYAGHAWASGTAPFADGNNQESSSEAVNAWNGLGLWAEASAQPALAVQATWLASTEAATARAYWTDPDLDDPVYQGYAHQVVALNWGGKRDYLTWFSPEPAAMLAIQLLPMSPVARYLAGDPDHIRAAVAEGAPGGFDVQFGDYLLMYLALAGPQDAETAWTAAQSLSATAIDDGDSRSYLLAWLAVAAAADGTSGS